ncbi:hypothetical protein V2J09_011065 [Rumex salicifolius]
MSDLVRGCVRSEGDEHGGKIGGGDQAVVVGVEPFESNTAANILREGKDSGIWDEDFRVSYVIANLQEFSTFCSRKVEGDESGTKGGFLMMWWTEHCREDTGRQMEG